MTALTRPSPHAAPGEADTAYWASDADVVARERRRALARWILRATVLVIVVLAALGGVR